MIDAMEDRDVDPRVLDYQAPGPVPAAPLYSILLSVIPHACILFFGIVQIGLPYGLVETLVGFVFVSSLIFSVIAVMYFTKRRKTLVAIAGIIIHGVWILAIIAAIALLKFHRH